MKKQRLSFATKAYLVAVLTLILGAIISHRLDDWSWLSRMGALIVINGIILTSHQILNHIQQLKNNQMRWQSQFNRDWAEHDKHHFIHQHEEWVSEKHGLYMLISGTFVWGFGDVLNYL